MSLLPHSIVPRNFKHADTSIEVSPKLTQAAAAEHADVFVELKSRETGLGEEEARRRLAEYGPNAVGGKQHFTRLKLLLKACLNPLVILLSVLAIITFATAQGKSDIAGAC
jgi:Mg2+-importing ATPase